MVGSLFGDKLIYEKEKTAKRNDPSGRKVYEKVETEVAGKYLGILNSTVYFRVNNGKLKEFNCGDVISILDNNRKPKKYDCSESTYIPRPLTELDIKEFQQKPIVGGSLIALGSLLLYTNADRECDDCETYDDVDEFYESVNSRQKLGFLILILGGVFTALGV